MRLNVLQCTTLSFRAASTSHARYWLELLQLVYLHELVPAFPVLEVANRVARDQPGFIVRVPHAGDRTLVCLTASKTFSIS